MILYFSVGWQKPYCFTINDNWKESNEESIVDGGFFHYNIPNRDQHVKRLAQNKFKFIMGFDRCPKDKNIKYLKYLQKQGQTICPIVHNLEQLDNLGVDAKWISTDSLDVLKHKANYKVHWLGSLPDKHLDRIDTVDINPYENNKAFLLKNLKLAKYQPISLPKEVLKLGEFFLYGSSLFVNEPNDYDLLYYGDEDTKDIKEMLPKEHKWNVCPVKEEEIHKGGVTHLLFGVENGIPLTDWPNIKILYDKAKENFPNIKDFVLKNKNFIAFRYMRDFQPVKEFKTLLIANHYIQQTPLTAFLYENLHLTYRVLQTEDKKAHLLLNRKLHQKFNKTLNHPILKFKHDVYKNHNIQEAYESFFQEQPNIYIDEEQIQIKLE